MSRRSRKEEFFKRNPKIADMLSSDLSLKSICDVQELRGVDVTHLSVPVLYLSKEVDYKFGLTTVSNLEKFLLKLVACGRNKGQFIINDCNYRKSDVEAIMMNMMKAYENIRPKYIEYFSGLKDIHLKTECLYKGRRITRVVITVTLQEEVRGNLMRTRMFLQGCNYVIEQLKKKGKLNKNMNKYEMAMVLFNWVVLHVRYDTEKTKAGQTGYAALFDGVAVCTGFTALYNALCKIIGIRIEGVAGKARGSTRSKLYVRHIWSLAYIMRKPVYIDVTWGSPTFRNSEVLLQHGIDEDDLCNFEEFDIPEERLKKTHIWEKYMK